MGTKKKAGRQADCLTDGEKNDTLIRREISLQPLKRGGAPQQSDREGGLHASSEREKVKRGRLCQLPPERKRAFHVQRKEGRKETGDAQGFPVSADQKRKTHDPVLPARKRQRRRGLGRERKIPLLPSSTATKNVSGSSSGKKRGKHYFVSGGSVPATGKRRQCYGGAVLSSSRGEGGETRLSPATSGEEQWRRVTI